MTTVLLIAAIAMLFYVVWATVQWARHPTPGGVPPGELKRLRYAAVLAVIFLLLVGVVGSGEGGDDREGGQPAATERPSEDQEPVTEVISDTTPETTPGTTPAQLAQREADEEAAREERRLVSARKSANRVKARKAAAARRSANRAKARRERVVRERKEANRVKARAENEARRIRQAEQAAADAAAAAPVYDDDDAAATGVDYASKYAGLNCGDIPETDFPTPPGDPEGWDRDSDGVSCES